jgi:hypothetical protein
MKGRTDRQIALEENLLIAKAEAAEARRQLDEEKQKHLLGKCFWYADDMMTTHVKVDEIGDWCPRGFTFAKIHEGRNISFSIAPDVPLLHVVDAETNGWMEIHIGVFDTAWQQFYEDMMANIPSVGQPDREEEKNVLPD